MREAAKASATMVGAVHVHGPRQRRIAGRAELHGGHVDDIGQLRQGLDGAAVQQVAGDGLDADRLQADAHGLIGEPSHADDALVRRRPLRHPGQRRPHLAGDAEDEDVAVKPWRGPRQARASARSGNPRARPRWRNVQAVGERSCCLSGVCGRDPAIRRRRHPARGREIHFRPNSEAGAGKRPECEPPIRRCAGGSGRRCARRDQDGRGRILPARAAGAAPCHR